MNTDHLAVSNTIEQIYFNIDYWGKKRDNFKIITISLFILLFLVSLSGNIFIILLVGLVTTICGVQLTKSKNEVIAWNKIKERKFELIENDKKIEETRKIKESNSLTLKVAGISHRQKEAKQLAKTIVSETDKYEGMTNSDIRDYGDQVFLMDQFYPLKAELVPEPNNKIDKNAMKIIVNGIHLGYIPKSKLEEYNHFVKNREIDFINLTLKGGKFKNTTYDDEIYTEEWDFYGELYIQLKY